MRFRFWLNQIHAIRSIYMKILYLNVFKSITSRVVLLFYTKWEIFENGKMHSYAPDYKEISVLLMKRLSLIF